MIYLLIVLAIVFFLWMRRANELFCVSVRHGRVLLVRGRVPPGLLTEFRDVVARPPVSSATIRAVREESHTRLAVSGSIDAGRVQRLRNVFGGYPAARLRSATRIRNPTLGQVLGIAWLAWLLDRSRGA